MLYVPKDQKVLDLPVIIPPDSLVISDKVKKKKKKQIYVMTRPKYKLFGPETPEEATESESYKISYKILDYKMWSSSDTHFGLS